ncbi:inovirus Gp2 family protein [Aeromonas hydrophila]|uniref:inovirus Gp2 family protein n=1 Tax=Aeromonas TaxID=642 RepID=UPI0039897CBE
MIQDGGFILNKNEFKQLLLEEGKKGEISPRYLKRSLERVYAALTKFRRVFAVRVDLRFAQPKLNDSPDMPMFFQDTDSKAITRFIESLKSQLREAHKRKGKRGEPSLFEYIWVREQKTSEHPHYHLVILFNKDEYFTLGDYNKHDADNLATRIQKAWCGALKLNYPMFAKLVHFPFDGSFVFDTVSATIHSDRYRKFLLRLVYLCKLYTKDIGDGYRNFGCSQA